VSFVAGMLVAGTYFFGSVLPRRLKGRTMGGATPLGALGVGNGWGYQAQKRAID